MLLMVSHRDSLSRMADMALQQTNSPTLAKLIRRGEVMRNPHENEANWRASVTLTRQVPDSDWLVALVENPQHLKIRSDRLFTYRYYLDILDYMAGSTTPG